MKVANTVSCNQRGLRQTTPQTSFFNNANESSIRQGEQEYLRLYYKRTKNFLGIT